jgi:DNA-directed RNA polymerase subunit RPC12/RpoP
MIPLPSLDRPPVGTLCPRCQGQLEFVDWCRCGWPNDPYGANPDFGAFGAGLKLEAELIQEGREQSIRLFYRHCKNCAREVPLRELEDGWCQDCAKRLALKPLPEDVVARERASVTGQVLVLSLYDPTWSLESTYRMARRAAGYALDALGRER